MLGPMLIVDGHVTEIPLPFATLRAIPFVNANRYPVRFNVMLMLALAVLIAFGAARLLSMRRGTVTLGALGVLLAFEQLALPIPLSDLRAPAVYYTLRAEPGDFTVLDLPLGWRNSIVIQGKLDFKSQFFQAVHEKRLISGQTSRNPAFKFQYFLELPVINSLIALETGREIDATRLAQDRAAAPEVQRFFDIRYIQVQRARTDAPVLQYVQEIFPLTEIYRDEEYIIYHVEALSPSPGSIDPQSETARMYFDDTWGRPQRAAPGFGYRWATTSAARVWLPLAKGDFRIKLRLMSPRPEQKVAVRLNNYPAGTLTIGDEWADYVVDIPAAARREGLSELVLATETTPLHAARRENYAIGGTGLVSPVDIVATGAGFHAGKFGQIFVAGRSVIPDRRGYHLVAVSPSSGNVDRVASFDTFADPTESARLAEFVAQLPHGEIVAGVAVDDVRHNLQPVAIDALRQLGVQGDVQFREGHAFVGVKGAQPGQALEQVDGRWPANVAVGKNVCSAQVSVALGGIGFEQVDR